MDNKSWLWRKKSSEKTITATNKLGISVKGIDEEIQKLPMGNEIGQVKAVRSLNEKLASVLLDSCGKDDLVLKQENLTHENIAGLEKAEEVICLKKELDKVIKQGVDANEKLIHSDDALQHCRQQLSSFQEDQEQKIHDAVINSSSEFEKVRKRLEDKLKEMSKRLADLAIENTNLSNVLVLKEKLVEELHKRSSQASAEFNALMTRLDSTEKENAFLRYEFHMLEKELEFHNEELEYSRRSADASHRQQLESVRKITKLESECQRLRILMGKKLPGHAALVKIKNEVEMPGRDPIESRRKPNPTRDLVLRDTTLEKSPEIPVKNMNFLIEQLRGMEEENKTLKGILSKKNAELRSSRFMYSQTASRLSQVEAHLTELCRGQKSMDLVKCRPISTELYPIPGFDTGSDDGVSSSGSWASALISELENFRDAKLKMPSSDRKAIEVSDINLMDDFLEMERLAIVSSQTTSGGSNYPPSAGKELVPVKDVATEKSFDWLQVVLSAIFRQQRISKRSLTELLEDIKIALGYTNYPHVPISKHLVESDIRRHITSKSTNLSSIVGSLSYASSIDTSAKETSKQGSQSNLSMSICKIVKLIEEIDQSIETTDNVSKREQNSSLLAAPADYFVHVLQWRSSELSDVLQRFVHTCNAMLDGKAGLESFAEEVALMLDWIMNNCVTPKDASSRRDKIKRHFRWSQSLRENEAGLAADCPLVEVDAKSSCLPMVASLHDDKIPVQMKSKQCSLQEENNRLLDELKNMESDRKDMGVRLQSATDKIENLMLQLQESKQSIESLQLELENTKASKGMIEDEMENQKSINEDLDTQLTVAKAKLNEVLQKFTSLEVELEEKSNCCEELEATCLELQLQLESDSKKDYLNSSINEEGAQYQNGSEIAAASLKLAECQETILNLGKQLKALATPREAALFDKVFNTTSSTSTAAINKNLNRRCSLRDQMVAEDSAKTIILCSPTKDATDHSNNGNVLSAHNVLAHTPEAKFDSKLKSGNTSAGSLAIVPRKKQEVGLLRRLLMRRKKGSSKKSQSFGKV